MYSGTLVVQADVQGVMDESSSARDARYANIDYNTGMLNSDAVTEIYCRPSTSQLHTQSVSGSDTIIGSSSEVNVSIASETPNMIMQSNTTGSAVLNMQRNLKRVSTGVCYNNDRQALSQTQSLNISRDYASDTTDGTYTNIGLPKKSSPSNGKKTKGRVKIKMEYIDNKLRRYTTFSKRKTGIMKKIF